MSAADSTFVQLLRRWPYCAGCVVLIVLSVAGAWMLREKVLDLRTVHVQRTTEGEAMLSLLVGGSTQKQELEAVREAIRRIDENLVVEANLAENLWYFYKLEEQTKVKLPDLHQLSSPAADKSPLYKRVPYTLRVTGTYDQTAAFLQALETGPRLVKVMNFNYARAELTGSIVALDLTIELLGKK